jgi:hypothetical protein
VEKEIRLEHPSFCICKVYGNKAYVQNYTLPPKLKHGKESPCVFGGHIIEMNIPTTMDSKK